MSHRFFDLYCKQLHTNLVNIYLTVISVLSHRDTLKKVYNFYYFKQVKQKPFVLSQTKIGKNKKLSKISLKNLDI